MEGESPRNVVEQLHHQADMIASCRQARFAVHEPCEELVEEFTDQADEDGEPLPDLESCELDEWL